MIAYDKFAKLPVSKSVIEALNISSELQFSTDLMHAPTCSTYLLLLSYQVINLCISIPCSNPVLIKKGENISQ